VRRRRAVERRPRRDERRPRRDERSPRRDGKHARHCEDPERSEGDEAIQPFIENWIASLRRNDEASPSLRGAKATSSVAPASAVRPVIERSP